MHKEGYDQFIKCTNKDKMTKPQLIGTLNGAYVSGKRIKHVGHANRTTLECLNNLCMDYAIITKGQLKENAKRMNEPCGPNQYIYRF